MAKFTRSKWKREIDSPPSDRGIVASGPGSIELDGVAIDRHPPHQRNIGFVFQLSGFYDHLNGSAEPLASLHVQKLTRIEEQSRLEWIVELLDLSSLLQRTPQQLSGGQLQRIALGRGLIRKPKVMLLDEPLNHLDAPLRQRLRRELRGLHEQLGMTTIYVTHDPEEAMWLGDRIAVLDSGEIAQVGSPTDLLHRPTHRKVLDTIMEARSFGRKGS